MKDFAKYVYEPLSKNNRKMINALRKSRNLRQKNKRFLVEGLRSVCEAINSNYKIDFIVLSESFLENTLQKNPQLIALINNNKIFRTSDQLFSELSDTVTPQGIMAVVEYKIFNLYEVISDNFLIIALDRVKDPGNVGTIIRSSDAACADAIIFSKGCVDIYNPKVIRSTMGSVFHIPLIQSEDFSKELIKLKELGGRIITTHLRAEKYYYEVDYTQPSIIVMGKEDEGVSEDVMKISDEIVKIPMLGRAESLNVSVAHGIMLYEAVSQRLGLRPFTCK